MYIDIYRQPVPALAPQGGESSAVAKALASVNASIEGGSLWKQATAIALLRLTPVVCGCRSQGRAPIKYGCFRGKPHTCSL